MTEEMLPKISLIIVTYLEQNQKYLDLCLKSVEALYYPKEKLEVIVVSSGAYEPKTPDFVKHVHSLHPMHYPSAVNYGVSFASPDSKHFLIANDDVIFTRSSVIEMVLCTGDNNWIIGPISTCDNQAKYNLIFAYGNKLATKRFHRYDDWASDIDDLIKGDSVYPRGVIVQDFICFYATLIPRKVWEKVGGLDPRYKTGQDDVDYCKRLKQHGMVPVICLSSLIWHFGGTSADVALTPEIRRENIEYYRQKWGELPP